jgi:triacylglycerol lipase
MTTPPRLSLPMYFPSGFALGDAVACATLVDTAYDQYAQWQNQGYPGAASFQWTTPRQSQYVYSAPFTWTYAWDFETYDEPFGFAALDNNANGYLVFRGTMNDADELQDAKIDQTGYTLVPGYGKVHLGFFEIYQLLSPQVLNAIAGLLRRGSPTRFFVTGHSLGSGLSSLAVPDVVAHSAIASKAVPILHYNLASPRVGDAQFAHAMNTNGVPTFRIVNTEDLVPDGPPAVSGAYLYKHIGTPVDFTAQYNSILSNHSLDTAYTYALANPTNPQGPLPRRKLMLARLPGVRVAIEGPLRRLPPLPPAVGGDGDGPQRKPAWQRRNPAPCRAAP